jgi:hypothetical protein
VPASGARHELSESPGASLLLRVVVRIDARSTKGPQTYGLLRERLKGLEPSTFCMASGSADGEEEANRLQM